MWENSIKCDTGIRVVFIFAVVGAIVPIYIIYTYFGNPPWQIELDKFAQLGPIGDLLSGSSMPFITFATLILVYLTYKSQSEEFKMTRNLVEKQNETSEKQRFENTFFSLLSLHHEIVNAIKHKDEKSQKEYDGRKYFFEAYGLFYEIYTYNRNIQNQPIYIPEKELDETTFNYRKSKIGTTEESLLKFSYEIFYDDHQENIGHYFRNLYHLLRLINESCLVNIEKLSYSKILGAQLSSYELVLLFYNCWVGHGSEHFKPMIFKYGMLDNMNIECLLDQKHIQEFEIIKDYYNNLFTGVINE